MEKLSQLYVLLGKGRERRLDTLEGAKRRLIIYINDELCFLAVERQGNGPTRRGNKQKAE